MSVWDGYGNQIGQNVTVWWEEKWLEENVLRAFVYVFLILVMKVSYGVVSYGMDEAILILSTHVRLGFPTGLLPSGSHLPNAASTLLTAIRSTCPAHLILPDLFNRTIFDEGYRSRF